MGNEVSHLAIHQGSAYIQQAGSQKRRTPNESAVDLDSLGGYFRPAVGRREELDVKTEWLGKAVHEQANKMEDALDIGHTTDKKVAMSVMGGPKKTDERSMAFGSSTEKSIPRRLRPKGSATSATANGHAGPPRPPSHFATIPEGAVGQNGLPISKSMGAAASLQALQRPGTTPMKNRGASTGPPTAQSSAASTRPNTAQGARPATSNPKMGRRTARAAAVAEAKKAAEAEEKLRQQHWRVRVSRAQRRLYLYLRTYMAWISILKKKRKGYAEPFTIEDLPVILATSLGDSQAQFGGHLKSLGQQLAAGGQQEARTRLGGIAGRWKALTAAKRSSTGDGGLVSQLSMSRRRANVGRAWEPQRTVEPTQVSPGVSLASKGRRQTARSMAPAGQGGAATVAAHMAPHKPALDSAANGQRAHPVARQLDPSLIAVYGGKSGSFKRSVGKKRLLDIVAAVAPKGEGVFKSQKLRDAAADRSAIEKSGDARSLQLLANKANARWVEKHLARGKTWTDPHVVDSKKLKHDGVDMGMYEQVSSNLLAQGKLALQLVYIGEEQAIGIGDGAVPQDTTSVPACTVDLWDVMSTHFPHKIPMGSRVTGLTLLDRRILQSLTDVEVQAGRSAVSQVVIVLCVDANVVRWVSDQAIAKHHWGLQEDQIIIVSIERFPGITWEPESRVFQVEYSHDVPYSSANSGYALLALNWPSHAFTVSKGGACNGNSSSASAGLPLLRNYIAGSVLKHLEQRGVQYLYSSRVCDFEALNPQTPSLDPGFCGPAIYAMDTQGANMAMQVVKGGTDTRARWLNSLVMAPSADSNFCCNVAMTDMQTAPTRAIVQSLNKQQSQLYSCTSRYLFQVRTLKTALTGPSSFHFKLQVKAPCAYLYLDMADVTSNLGANCAAILAQGPTRGPEALTTVFSKHWIRDSSIVLVQQEAQPSFRTRAIACLGNAAPLLLGSSPTSNGTMANGADDPWARSKTGASARGGTRVLLLVRDNQASRSAYRLARQLIKLPGDVLILVHIVSALAAPKEGEALLASFTSAMTDAQTKRRVVQQKEGMIETVQHQVDELKPDLFVLGTEHLVHAEAVGRNQGFKAPSSALGAQVVSFALAVARTVTEVPLLVVKSNSAGELFNQQESASPALRVMVEAQSVSATLLQWLLPRMSPQRDHLYLARPFGLDQANQVTPQTQRLLNTLNIEAAALGRNVRKLPMREGPGEGFPPLVVKESIDILGLIAPSAKITPPHILDIIRTARTNVLVWRNEQRAGL